MRLPNNVLNFFTNLKLNNTNLVIFPKNNTKYLVKRVKSIYTIVS